MTQWQPQQIERLQLIGVMLQFHRDDRPLDRLAARLQIDPAVLLALEAGKVELLPTPKQTRLIIHHYAQVLGVEYLKLADSLPLISVEKGSEKGSFRDRPPTNGISSPRMPKRSRKRRWLPSKRRWRRFSTQPIWQHFPVRLSALTKLKNLPNWKNLGDRGQILPLWLGIALIFGACLGVIVAIVHLVFVLLSPEGRMMFQQSPWGIFWLGVFEFLKVFISFLCLFALLAGLGSGKRSPNPPKVPPNDSEERNETPHDR